MSQNTIVAYKQLGETPLECLERTRKKLEIGADIPMTYAGRLDPMAEGVMVLLAGEECKNKEKYLGLSKTYQFEILAGFSTDTHDLLGIVIPSIEGVNDFLGPQISSFLLCSSSEKARPDRKKSFTLSELQSNLSKFIGTFIQKYPSFSSKTINGKQLFQLSKDDELPNELPEHKVTINKLQCTSTMTFTKEDLQKEILRRINLVKGDFRQEKIIQKWEKAFARSEQDVYRIFSCIAECSSGTYIRQLVADIARSVGSPLVTYSIKRIKVGDYELPSPES